MAREFSDDKGDLHVAHGLPVANLGVPDNVYEVSIAPRGTTGNSPMVYGQHHQLLWYNTRFWSSTLYSSRNTNRGVSCHGGTAFQRHSASRTPGTGKFEKVSSSYVEVNHIVITLRWCVLLYSCSFCLSMCFWISRFVCKYGDL